MVHEMSRSLEEALDGIKVNAELHQHKRDDIDLAMLVEEVGELAEWLRQDGKKPDSMLSVAMQYELEQIGGICANWIARLIDER